MNFFSIVVEFLTSAFSGIATKLLGSREKNDNSKLEITKNTKSKISRNTFSGRTKISGNNETIIKGNKVIG